MQLAKGANTALPSGAMTMRVSWSSLAAAVQDVDVSAFLLTTEGRVTGDEGMVFYGQRQSPDGAVKIDQLSQGGATTLVIDPSRVTGGIARIAVTATLTAEGTRPFSDVGKLELVVEAGGSTVATFPLETQGASEAAMILGEVYERNGAWKFRAVGQGFNGGLQPLAEHYGVTIDASAEAPPPEPPKAQPSPSTVNLSKISLSKSSPTISLEKKGGTLGEITINLDWNQGEPQKKGLFGLGGTSGASTSTCAAFSSSRMASASGSRRWAATSAPTTTHPTSSSLATTARGPSPAASGCGSTAESGTRSGAS